MESWKPKLRDAADLVEVMIGRYLVAGSVGNYRSQSDEINRLRTQVSNLEQRFNGIESSREKLESSIQDLKERLADLRGRR